MAAQSAGILVWRRAGGGIEVLLAHPGGPLWAKKDAGAWSIPKGEFLEGEEPLAAAQREFTEEMGRPIDGVFLALSPCKQRSGKVVHAFAVEGDFNAGPVESNLFEMEWPPKSGRKQSFPEVDRAEWFTLDEAKRRINPGQVPIIEELARKLGR